MTTNKATLEKIGRLKWYQSIPLGNGSKTPGETGDSESVKMEMMQLPDDLGGKTVLDIGCNEGFYSFEADKRGADRVLAIDKSPAAKEKFMLIQELFDSGVEFKAVNLLDLDPAECGKFDIVFFLAVFHHLRYPFLALDRIYSLTREYAIMEFVEAVSKTGSEDAALVRKMSKKGHLHMLPTRQFVYDMLSQAKFSRVELLGDHREHEVGEYRKMPGFTERRMLVKAFR